MGYTTKFKGGFTLNQALTKAQAAYLRKFAETRRMGRNPALLQGELDLIRTAVGLPLGEEGGYFVGSRAPFGQDFEHPSVLANGRPPIGQPGLWCKWVPSRDRKKIMWSGAEKFYDYTAWLTYLITHFLAPWGYVLNGQVRWQGEDKSDVGTIYVEDNTVSAVAGASREERLSRGEPLDLSNEFESQYS